MKISIKNHKHEIVGYALIDREDLPLINQYKWHLRKGYATTTIPHPLGGYDIKGRKRQKCLFMHRLILNLSEENKIKVDHKDRNTLNNHKNNLRLANYKLNGQNRKSNIDSTSKYRGVSWLTCKNRWRAICVLNGKQYYLGLFKDEDEAGRITAEWRSKYMPFSID